MARSEVKRPFKEKIVQIYEAFFQGDDPSQKSSHFWDEFFLLRANVCYIVEKFEELSFEDVIKLKDIINTLFYECVQILKDGNQIRIMNSLHTMCALVHGIFDHNRNATGFDAINVLIGFPSADQLMQVLIGHLSDFLVLDYPIPLKSLTLKFLLILATVTENVSQNTLLEYLMINSLFEPIIQLLKDSKSRQYHGSDALLLLTTLVNYRKHEATNPYVVKLSIIDDEMALNGFGQVVSLALSDFIRSYNSIQKQSQSLFSSFSSFVETMFVSEEAIEDHHNIKANNAVLLALYEAVHLNRNFLITLTHCQVDVLEPLSAPLTKEKNMTQDCDLSPSNLLVTFLEFSSIIMLQTREESSMNTCKLCFIILTCIAEDQYANSIIHDINLVYKVQLQQMPMRHRKVSPEKSHTFRPLACPLLDLMVEFILSHLTKCLPFELYHLCLGVIHRILCYQKKTRVRLQYNWKELWTALISLIKFLTTQESLLTKNCNIFLLSMQVMNVFNLFITFGDTFLHSPACYDELYYELIRMSTTFDNLYSLALRYTTVEGEWKDFASKLMNSLVNTRAILNHFSPKIEATLIESNTSALTEDQVLDVVKQNYDTLTLKLHDNLDQYEKYREKPNETAFFTPLVRSVVCEYKKSFDYKCVDTQSILKDFCARD